MCYAMGCSFSAILEQMLSDGPPACLKKYSMHGNGSKVMICCKSEDVFALHT